MSYCRFIEADAYIYDDIKFGLLCCMCALSSVQQKYSEKLNMVVSYTDDFIAGYDYDKMLAHVAEHRQKGDFIPEYVDERLIFERDCNHELKNTLNSQTCKICGRWWENDT